MRGAPLALQIRQIPQPTRLELLEQAQLALQPKVNQFKPACK
jgi:hypothetical protein